LKYLMNWLNTMPFPDQVKAIAEVILVSKFLSKSVGELLSEKLREIIVPELSDAVSLVDSNDLAVFELFTLIANVKRFGHIASSLIEMEALAKQIEDSCKGKPLAEAMEWINNLSYYFLLLSLLGLIVSPCRQGLSGNIEAQIPLEYQREKFLLSASKPGMMSRFFSCFSYSPQVTAPTGEDLMQVDPKPDPSPVELNNNIDFPSLNDFAMSASLYRAKVLQMFAVVLIQRCLRETMAIEQNRAAAQAKKQ